ncbi:Kinesin light chain 3 [Chytriomyces hyalinus]|nr:Kinesin light chain 3 [Chytriomyces hyalinus]
MATKFVKETARTTTTTRTVSSNGEVSARIHTASSVRLAERDNARQQELAPSVSNGHSTDVVEIDKTDHPESANSEIRVKSTDISTTYPSLEAHLVLPVLKNIGATSIDNADADAHSSNGSETPYDPLAMTTLGFPLKFVQDFITASGGSETLKNLTTTDVCQKLVQPLTSHTRRSMIDTLIIEGRSGVVSEAKWFVSHPGRIPAKEFIIWFDIFSNSQHETASKPFEWWENTFMSAIKKMGQVVMVLIPWSEPIPLTRAWCIFEIYSTVKTGSVFDVAMPSRSQVEFLVELRNNPRAFYEIIANFESRNAEATNPVDKHRIFQVIAELLGSKVAPEDTLLLHWSLASLYRLNGKLPLAFDSHRSVYLDRLKLLGPDHVDTLISMNSMIECAFDISYTSKTKSETDYAALMEECLATAKRTLGLDHPFTLLAMYNTTSTFIDEVTFEKAEAVLSECLERRMKGLGSHHPETLRTMERLATVYAKMNLTAKAESFYKLIIELFEDRHGSNNMDGLIYSTSLVLYHDVGEYDKAASLFQDILKSVAEGEGIDTITSLGVMHYLAETLQSQGQLDQSLNMRKDCLARTRKLLGDNHENTLAFVHAIGSAYFNLGSLLVQIGSLDEADSMLTNAVRLWRIVIERETMENLHPDFLTAFNVLGIVKKLVGDRELEKGDRGTAVVKYTECVAMFTEAYEGRSKLLGEEAEETKESFGGMRSSKADLLLLSDAQDLESRFLKVSKLFELDSSHADALIDSLVSESKSLPKDDLLSIRIQMLHADILMYNLDTSSNLMASQIFESCIVLLEASFEETHLLALEALQKAGQIYMKMQCFDKAHKKFIPLFKRTAIVYGEAVGALRFLNMARMGVMTLADQRKIEPLEV